MINMVVTECQECLTEDNYWNMSKCKCLLEVEESNKNKDNNE